MKTETRKLEILLFLALQNKRHNPASHTELINSMDDLHTALELALYRNNPNLYTDLCRAANVLANCLFLCSNSKIQLNSNPQSVIKRATQLNQLVNHYLREFCNIKVFEYKPMPLKNLLKTLEQVNDDLKQNPAIEGLYHLLEPLITGVLAANSMAYNRWIWWCRFAVNYTGYINDRASFSEFLIELNFNCPSFISWLSNALIVELSGEANPLEKLQLLSDNFLKYRRLKHSSIGYIPAENSVAVSMILYIKTKLFCLTQTPSFQEHVQNSGDIYKLHTTMSVPQLALFIRLMVDTKILNENNQSALIKNIAGIISTSKAAAVSSESLRVNYYTPNNAAKTIVKDYLLQMMRLVTTY